MSETITLDVELHGYVRRETDERWIALCPSIGVATQGISPNDARRSLNEAVQLWFESCIERGTLERALQESNFRPSSLGRPPAEEPVNAGTNGDNLLGEPFTLHVAIPAYQATALLSTAV